MIKLTKNQQSELNKIEEEGSVTINPSLSHLRYRTLHALVDKGLLIEEQATTSNYWQSDDIVFKLKPH